MRPLLAFVIAAALVAPAAYADNTADEADIAFELGNQLYAKGQYVEALREYFQSYRLVPNRNVLFNIARCYEALDRYDEAYRYYYDLTKLDLSASDKQDVAQAMGRIRPKVALVAVESSPPGAEVFIDREDLGSRGQAPQVLAVRPGKHSVIVKLAGHHRVEAEVTLTRGRQVEKRIELAPILGEVQLFGGPEGAEVRLDPSGPVVGKVPGMARVPVGQRVLHVSANGFTTAQLLVDVSEQKAAVLKVALAPAIGPSGKVIVTANRDNARVRVDGKDVGFTPTVLTLAEGDHQIEVTKEEMRAVRERVRVVRDQERSVQAVLRYAPPPVKAASKGMLALDEAPASTSVITSEEIRAFGYQTLVEALDGIRGVFVSDDRSYSYLGIRGFAPPGDLNTRVLILWDGHPMNDVWAGQGYAARDLSVDLEDVDRIEIVRGPGSALYGTSALFAVINVVPRERLQEGKTVEVSGASGGLGSWRGHATVAGTLPMGMTALVSAAAYRARGSDYTDLGSLGLVTGLDGERAYHATARLEWGGLTALAQINYREKDVPTAPFNTVVGAPGTTALDGRAFAELRYEAETGFGAVSARAYYDASRYKGTWAYQDVPGDPLYISSYTGDADWVGGEARGRIRLFGENQLTVGVEAQHHLRVEHAIYGYGSDGPLDTLQRTILSGYALDEWQLHPKVFLSLGLRVDKYSDLDTLPITPRAAVILRPYAAGVTKLVAGTAFRAPNVYELFNEDRGVSIVTPDALNPETITTVEFEHSHDVNEELRLTASGYWNRISNLVVLTEQSLPVPGCGNSTVQCLQFANVTTPMSALGAEAELRWQAGRWALLDLSYSFVYLTAPTRGITATPAHLVTGKVLLPLADTGARVALRAKYQTARSIEGQPATGEALLVDVGISGEAGNFRYFAGVTNILDARYQLPFGPDYGGPVPQLGRLFQIQLSATY